MTDTAEGRDRIPMTPETIEPDGRPPANSGPLSEGQLRLLKLAVYGMGVLLIVGFLVIIGRIIYLIAQTPPAPATAQIDPGAPLKSAAKLELPAGASIRHLSVAGNRLAIQYDAPGGSAIVIFDMASGSVLSRIAITTSETGR